MHFSEHLIKLAELNAAKAKKLALERRILQAAARGLTHLCVIRVPENYGDLSASSVSGAIYQAALSAYSRRVDKTEAAVMEEIRLQRRFSTPPETARMQLEPSTSMLPIHIDVLQVLSLRPLSYLVF
ncbi:unnamed protein product [Protopolystoma xenopodis]|uniref:Uncharacterized protein n=1 Tax=Protopolystoma xenopodis TaxID=117903 RepID=A0A3S5A1B8_9PLAT|nr:unnamed protein product [Protopolystoma xenopodis]